MPTFDLDTYFTKRAELDAASEQKQAELVAKRAELEQQAARQSAQQQQVLGETWVGKLGLDPEGITGTAVNLGANLAEGGLRIVNNIGSSIHAARAAAELSGIPDNVKEAFSRYTEGKASRDDLTLLALPAGDAAPNKPLAPYQKIARAQAEKEGKLQTNLDRLRSAQYALADTQAMQDFDKQAIAPITERTRQNALQNDLRAGFKENLAKVTDGGAMDKVSGLAGMLVNIGTSAASNPVASLEYITNNAPQLGLAAGGGAGMALTNIPYAIDEFGKGLTAYQEQHGGKMPPEAELQKMALKAASLAAAETLGDKAVLGAGKLVPQAAKDAARTGLKKALLGNAVGRTIGAAAEGATGEFLTEAYQTGMENNIEGKAFSPEEVYVGGAIGAIAGAGLSGGMHGASELAGREKDKAAEPTPQEKEVKAAAIASGDVAAYLDPKAKTYAPAKAVEALLGNSQQESATPEQRDANHVQASQIVTALQTQRDILSERIASATPEGKAQAAQQIDALRAQLATATPEQRAGLEEHISLAEQDLADAPSDKDVARWQKQLEQTDAHLQASQHVLRAMTAEQAMGVDVGAELANMTAQPDTAPATAAKLIRVAMASPQALSIEQANMLAEMPGLSEDQKTFLRTFSQARAEENRLKDAGGVSQEIYTGSKPNSPRGYVGIAQYRERVAQAIAAGDQEQAQKQLAGLTAFAQDHAAKATAAEQGMQQGRGNQIVKNQATKAWEVAPRDTYTDAQIRANGGHTLNSPKMVADFRMEANALKAARNELQAAIALHFKQNNQGASNVQNTSAVASQTGQEGPGPQSVAGAVQEAAPQDATGSGSPDAARTEVATAQPPAPATQAQPEAAGDVVQAEQNTQTQEEAPADTRLDLFQEASPEGIPFLERKNPIADFFRQIIHRTDAKTQRPLASVKNFLSQWNAGTLDPARFIQGGVQFKEQRAALEDLRARLTGWVPKIQANLKNDDKTPPEYRMADMMQYLLSVQDGKPVVEENVATAIAYSAYDWLLEAARSPAHMTDNQINRFFGRDKDAYIYPDNKRFLQSLQAHEFNVINDLGRLAVQSLGLKPKNDAPQDLMPRLQFALGTHAMAVLTYDGQTNQEGTLERVRVSPQKLMQMVSGVLDDSLSPKPITLVRVKRKGDEHRVDPAIKSVLADVKRANVGSGDVVSKLFGIEKAPRFATTEPVKFVQKFAQGTRQKISKLQRKVIEATMATPHTAIPEMIAMHAGLGKDAFLQIAGVKALSQFHKVNQAGVEAQNQNLHNQYDLMWEMLDNPANPEGYETEFFVQQSVWKNFRAGFTTQSLNQQTSKIHRYMFSRPNWVSTIDPAKADHVQKFNLALATNFGLKVENQSLEATLAAWEDHKAKHPEIMQAVQSLAAKEELDQDWTSAERELVTKIATSHEGMMTLQALTAMVKFEQAKGKPVEITMLVGADGKTNGPMLTHLALGAAADADALFKVLNQGGMYSTDEGQPDSYGNYYSRPQALDLYEGLGAKILDAAKLRMKPLSEIKKLHQAKMHKEAFGLFTPEAWNAFQSLVGNLRGDDGKVTKAGRNLTKTPLTAFGFGSSLTNSIKSMQDAFIDGLYTTMEKIANGKHDKLTPEGFIAAVNALIAFGDYQAQPLRLQTDTALLHTKLEPKQEAALRAAFQRVIGNAVQDAMRDHFGIFITRRGDLNKTIQGAFATYQQTYAALREAKLQELMASGEVASRINTKGKTVPLHDLSAAQEEALRKEVAKLLPVMHTDYSLQEGNLEVGLYMAKSDKSKIDDVLYQSKVWLANPIANSQNNKQNFLTGAGQLNREKSPGVAGVSYVIHSSDSAIMHKAIDKADQSMNVHDEIGNGVDKIDGAASAINQATAETFLEYSPAREAANMFERIVVEAAAKLKDGVIGKEVVAKLYKEWAATLNWGVPADKKIDAALAGSTMLSTAFTNALNADTVRLGALAKMAVMDQYPWHGGTFTVTPEIRAAAQAKLDSLPANPSPLLEAAIRSLDAAYQQAVSEGVKAEAEATPMESSTVQEYPATQSSFWGPVGKPVVSSDMVLVSWFEANPNATVRDVIAMVRDRLAGNPTQNALYRLLLGQLVKSAPLNMPVRYITPDTDPAVAVGGVEPNARGWHTTGTGIFVLGTQFQYSGLTAELLLHEMVHAALVDTVENATGPAAELVNSLKALQQQAIDFAKQQGNYEQYASKLDNLHEFIAYGMTDTAFQTELLQQIRVAPVSKMGALVDGMKAFIQHVAALFFGSIAESQTNALGLLIHNVSGLLSHAAQEQAKSGKTIRSGMAAGVASYSTQDIYTAIDTGAVSPSFSSHLRSLLSTIVETLHGPFGTFAASLMQSPVQSAFDTWTQAKVTGQAPFASLAIASGLAISEQEAFVAEQIEATVRAALDGNETQTKMAYRELARLYKEAEQKLRGTSHAFLFDIPRNGNRSDYLARFAALGLAHEGFNTALKFATEERVNTAPTTLADKVQAWVQRALGWFQEKVLKTYDGQPADAKLQMLVQHLTGIEAMKRGTVMRQTFNFIEPLEQIVKKGSEAARAGVTAALNTNIVRNHANPFVRATGSMARTFVNGNVKYFLEGVQKLRNQAMDRKNGMAMSLLNEFVGADHALQTVLRGTKENERLRKEVINNASAAVLDYFENQGKDLTREQKSVLGEALLQTGAHHLLANTSMADLEQLLADPAALQAKITATEQQLTGSPLIQNYMRAHADALAYFKVTGVTAVDVLRMNAHQIAHLSGTAHTGRVTEQDAAHNMPVLSQLIALYALSHLSTEQKTATRAVLSRENARTDGNGVEFMLHLHQSMEQESLQRLFNGNPALMIHGYTPEIYNPYTEIAVGDDQPRFDTAGLPLPSSAEVLRERGFTQVTSLTVDPKDPEQHPRYLFVQRDAGLTPRVTGAFSFTGKSAKGSAKHNGTLNVNTTTGANNANMQASITADAMANDNRLFNQTGRRNLKAETSSRLAPLFNENGDIVNWRYMMTKNTRQLMEPDTQFDQLIGTLAGSIFDKPASREQNREVIQTLKDIARDPQNGFTQRSADFLDVSPVSQDPAMRELWHLLPDDTKRDIRSVWGRDGLYVKKDAVDTVFGYRKFSLTDMFDKNPAARKTVEQIAIHFAEAFFGRQARTKVRTFERVWQELVREAKDLIVIKTGTVMLGNIISNTWLLWQYGVPLKDMAHHQYVAIIGATAYQKDSTQLGKLRLQRDSGYLTGAALDNVNREIAKLEDAIDRNPIKELVDAGLMPTIVEDVAAEENEYSYKSLAKKKLEGITSKIPAPVQTIAKQVYLAHDTGVYQALSRITQLSDFVARYTLYHHLIERRTNPLTKEEAIQKASDSFINYDVPMHIGLQYLEDMGFLMFNKYFLRIQRVLGTLFKDNPSRMLATMAMKHFISTGSTVLDSSLWHRVGYNPVKAGALELPGALDELLTVNLAMKML